MNDLDLYRQSQLALEWNRSPTSTEQCRPGCPVCRDAVKSLGEAEPDDGVNE